MKSKLRVDLKQTKSTNWCFGYKCQVVQNKQKQKDAACLIVKNNQKHKQNN